jgi:hypothetical protein
MSEMPLQRVIHDADHATRPRVCCPGRRTARRVAGSPLYGQAPRRGSHERLEALPVEQDYPVERAEPQFTTASPQADSL